MKIEASGLKRSTQRERWIAQRLSNGGRLMNDGRVNSRAKLMQSLVSSSTHETQNETSCILAGLTACERSSTDMKLATNRSVESDGSSIPRRSEMLTTIFSLDSSISMRRFVSLYWHDCYSKRSPSILNISRLNPPSTLLPGDHSLSASIEITRRARTYLRYVC